jgi:hypothetical protein
MVAGSFVSDIARSTIPSPLGDLDCDGVINFDDIDPYAAALGSGRLHG